MDSDYLSSNILYIDSPYFELARAYHRIIIKC